MAKKILRNSLVAICSEQDLQCWFDPLEITHDAATNRLVVTFPHIFFKNWFVERGRLCFENQARLLFGSQLEIRYATPVEVPGSRLPPLHTPESRTVPFGAEWTFETFVSNAKHKLVLGALRRLPVKDPSALCPLVIGGPTGTGKTHLLRAAANEFFRTLGDKVYCSSTDELAEALDRDSAATRAELRRSVVLLLDDAHRLADHPRLQEELIAVLNRFEEEQKPTLLAGTGRIADWALQEELRSRLEGGLWTEMPEPDLDVRLRFLQNLLKIGRTGLDREQMLLVAQSCTDMRRLCGAARRITAHRLLLGRDPVQRDIENILRTSGVGSNLSPQRIITLVGEHCGFTGKEILGDKRRPDLVRARQIAMFLCRNLLGHSYPIIGRFFGGKDHSTVIHAVKKIKQLQEHDRIVHTMVTELTKRCREAQD